MTDKNYRVNRLCLIRRYWNIHKCRPKQVVLVAWRWKTARNARVLRSEQNKTKLQLRRS